MLQVTKYESTNEPESRVVAYVDFFIPEWGLSLNRCKYIRKKNGGFFVGYPAWREGAEGEKPKYNPYFCFDKERHERFQSSSQKAIQNWIKEHNG